MKLGICFGFQFFALFAMTGCTEDTMVVQADVAADTEVPQDVSGTELTETDAATTDVLANDVVEDTGSTTDTDAETDAQLPQTDIAATTDAGAGTDAISETDAAAETEAVATDVANASDDAPATTDAVATDIADTTDVLDSPDLPPIGTDVAAETDAGATTDSVDPDSGSGTTDVQVQTDTAELADELSGTDVAVDVGTDSVDTADPPEDTGSDSITGTDALPGSDAEADSEVATDIGPDVAPPECTLASDCTSATEPCRVAACLSDGSCAIVLAVDTTPCEDGDACTANDACADGDCVGTAVDCNDGNSCTADTCAPATGCDSAADPTATCSDNDACTVNDACSEKTCVSGPSAVCNDANVCTTDSCNSSAGCQYVANSEICSDDNACTLGDACADSQCVHGSPKDCDDGIGCTVDACQTGGTCTSTPSAALCDDGNVCTIDSCNATKRYCEYAAQSGTECDDGTACTDSSVCRNGRCERGVIGLVSTIAGSGAQGLQNGPATSAQFYDPSGVLVLPDGGILVSERGNHTIRLIKNGVVSTFAGTGVAGHLNGPTSTAQLFEPHDIVRAADGTLYIGESGGDRIRKIGLDMSVSLLAGSASGSSGYVDGLGEVARFSNVVQLVVTPSGDILAADYDNHAIRQITPPGLVSTLVGGKGAGGTNGPKRSAKLHGPAGLALDTAGNLYISEYAGHRIRRLGVDGMVTTALGSGVAGYGTGLGALGQVDTPFELVWHPADLLLVADRQNHRIRALWPDGSNAVVAGTGDTGYVDGPGGSAQLIRPTGLFLDTNGNVLYTDSGNQRVRSVTLPWKHCDDGLPCTVDSCNAETGLCSHVSIAAGSACEDGKPCTRNEVCIGDGSCAGTLVDCDDGNVCTTDSCDPNRGGCVHDFNAAPCDDGDICTVGNTCLAGKCGLPVYCSDGNPCTLDQCVAGNCSYFPQANCCANSAACDDGNACTTDTCDVVCEGTVHGGSCYRGFLRHWTWESAEAECQAWGGHLASIASSAENSAVRTAASAVCGDVQEIAIGLTDSGNEGVFKWTDGSGLSYINWAAQEPNNALGICPSTGEDIATIWPGDGTWNDFCAGSALSCLVCERPLPAGKCNHTFKPSCCALNKDCDDGDACTTDVCVAGSPNTCSHQVVPNCCETTVASFDFGAASSNTTITNSAGTSLGWQQWLQAPTAMSVPGALYYGDPTGQDFDFGASSGTWQWQGTLPTAVQVTLSMWVKFEVEQSAAYDRIWLTVTGSDGWERILWHKNSQGAMQGHWQRWSFDLSAYKNQTVQLILHVNTVDAVANQSLGVLIDDIVVERNCP